MRHRRRNPDGLNIPLLLGGAVVGAASAFGQQFLVNQATGATMSSSPTGPAGWGTLALGSAGIGMGIAGLVGGIMGKSMATAAVGVIAGGAAAFGAYQMALPPSTTGATGLHGPPTQMRQFHPMHPGSMPHQATVRGHIPANAIGNIENLRRLLPSEESTPEGMVNGWAMDPVTAAANMVIPASAAPTPGATPPNTSNVAAANTPAVAPTTPVAGPHSPAMVHALAFHYGGVSPNAIGNIPPSAIGNVPPSAIGAPLPSEESTPMAMSGQWEDYHYPNPTVMQERRGPITAPANQLIGHVNVAPAVPIG